MSESKNSESPQGAFYRSIFELANDGIALLHEGKFHQCNNRALEILDRPREQIIGHYPWEFSPAIQPDGQDTKEKARAILDRGYAGEKQVFEWEHTADDGTPLVLEVSLSLIPDTGDTYLLCHLRDITVRLHTQEALRKSEESYRRIVEDQTDAIFRWLPDGMRTFVNESYCRLVGKSREELIGSSFFDEIAEDDRDRIARNVSRLTRENPISVDKHLAKTPGGEDRWHRWIDHALFDDDDNIIELQSVGRDIHDRVVLEDALRDSEEKFKKAFRYCPSPIMLARKDNGFIVEVNRAFERMTGYRKEEVYGRTSVDLGIFSTEEERTSFVEMVEAGKVRDWEFGVKIKTGEIRNCILSSEIILIGGEAHVLNLAQDETERLKLGEQLVQAQKMEAVGQLTSGIAHDFGNLLTVIKGNLSLLQQELVEAGNNDALELVDDALSATEDGVDITRRLLGFSRTQAQAAIDVDLNDLLAGFRRLTDRSLGDNFILDISVDNNLPKVHVNKAQLESSLLNLVINARDAMKESGKILLQASYQYFDRQAGTCCADYEPGEYVAIKISDDGVGMSKDIVSKVCEPFFTTKAGSGGTGLGISMVYGFVKQSGGGLIIDSRLGNGTDVTMLLPRSSLVMNPDRETDTNKVNVKHLGTVLVVEDKPPVRRLALRILNNLGYTTIEAHDSDDARKILQQDGSVDVLFSDVLMPGEINGFELANWVSDQYPGIQILLTTASLDTLANVQSTSLKHYPVLPKPYTSQSLARELDRLIQP